VLDLIGGWRPAGGIAQRAPVQLFSIANSRIAPQMIARFLIGKGHKRIAYISPLHEAYWSQVRLSELVKTYSASGANDAVTAFTINREYLDFADEMPDLHHAATRVQLAGKWRKPIDMSVWPFINESMLIAVRKLYPLGIICNHLIPLFEKALTTSDITAWVCCNDYIALLAMDFLKERGVDIPGQISVVGFDNCFEGMNAGLTTCDFNIAAHVGAMIRHIVENRPRRRSAFGNEIEGMIVDRHTT
jgi:DNA-binding LacI/PurR family transcriptional regulator